MSFLTQMFTAIFVHNTCDNYREIIFWKRIHYATIFTVLTVGPHKEEVPPRNPIKAYFYEIMSPEKKTDTDYEQKRKAIS